MVNTRILEQRLGWRSGATTEGGEPPARRLSHEPLLQGRVRSTRPMTTPIRRAEAEAIWDALPVVADTIEDRAPSCVTLEREGPAATALDQLRTKLMRVAKANGWRRIGVTSPSPGCGRTSVAVGLAASIARLDTLRVLLIDMDLPAPGLSRKLGIRAPGPLEAFLSGDMPVEEHVQRVGSNLALALNDTPVPQPGEVVHDPEAIRTLSTLIDSLAPDIVIHDLPPLLGDAATIGFLPQLDAVLLVADGARTLARDIVECERLLDGQVPLLGVVLNKSDETGPGGRARPRR